MISSFYTTNLQKTRIQKEIILTNFPKNCGRVGIDFWLFGAPKKNEQVILSGRSHGGWGPLGKSFSLCQRTTKTS